MQKSLSNLQKLSIWIKEGRERRENLREGGKRGEWRERERERGWGREGVREGEIEGGRREIITVSK